MLRQQDVDYFLKREVEERAQANSCTDPAASAAHFELAERYADAAWSAEQELDSPVRASGLWPQHDLPAERMSMRR
jgi:hypothetical protein